MSSHLETFEQININVNAHGPNLFQEMCCFVKQALDILPNVLS